jgi:hypothetical protein
MPLSGVFVKAVTEPSKEYAIRQFNQEVARYQSTHLVLALCSNMHWITLCRRAINSQLAALCQNARCLLAQWKQESTSCNCSRVSLFLLCDLVWSWFVFQPVWRRDLEGCIGKEAVHYRFAANLRCYPIGSCKYAHSALILSLNLGFFQSTLCTPVVLCTETSRYVSQRSLKNKIQLILVSGCAFEAGEHYGR